MQFNAQLLAAVIPRSTLVDSPAAAQRAWQRDQLAICLPLSWLEADEAQGRPVPHRWQFTSDSIAAHLATQLSAAQLTLLKSVTPSDQMTLAQASAAGIVDECFPEAAGRLQRIDIVNLRETREPVPLLLANA